MRTWANAQFSVPRLRGESISEDLGKCTVQCPRAKGKSISEDLGKCTVQCPKAKGEA